MSQKLAIRTLLILLHGLHHDGVHTQSFKFSLRFIFKKIVYVPPLYRWNRIDGQLGSIHHSFVVIGAYLSSIICNSMYLRLLAIFSHDILILLSKAGMHIYARASAKGKRVQVSIISTLAKSIPFLLWVMWFLLYACNG